MARAIPLVLVVSMTLGACGTVRDSRLNPVNWFGRSVSEPAAVQPDATGAANPLIPERRQSILTSSSDQGYQGRPIDEVLSVSVERRPGGAIVRAVGQANVGQPFDVRLVRDEAADGEDGGTLTYSLQALRAQGGTPASRRVTAAVFLSDQDLRGISTIRVAGRTNAQVSRR